MPTRAVGLRRVDDVTKVWAEKEKARLSPTWPSIKVRRALTHWNPCSHRLEFSTSWRSVQSKSKEAALRHTDKRHRWVKEYGRDRLGKPERVRAHWWPRRQDSRD